MGVKTLTSLIQGLTQALPQLVQMLPQIITTIVNYITSHLPEILKMGIQILLAAGQIVGTILQTVATLPSQMLSVGLELVEGIWDGISNGTSWIKSKIKSWVGNVTKFIKNLFGIHSPSTVMRDEVGKYLALGIGEGFTDEMKYVAKNMVAAVPMDFSVGSGVTNMGGVTINIQGAEGQDVEELANIVMYKMQRVVDRREAVFA